MYSRTGVSIANDSYSENTVLDFEILAYREFTTSAFPDCGTELNKVDGGTFTITVHYTYCPAPSLGIQINSQSQLNLFSSLIDITCPNWNLVILEIGDYLVLGSSDISDISGLSSITDLAWISFLNCDNLTTINLNFLNSLEALTINYNDILTETIISNLSSIGLIDFIDNPLLEVVSSINLVESNIMNFYGNPSL